MLALRSVFLSQLFLACDCEPSTLGTDYVTATATTAATTAAAAATTTTTTTTPRAATTCTFRTFVAHEFVDVLQQCCLLLDNITLARRTHDEHMLQTKSFRLRLGGSDSFPLCGGPRAARALELVLQALHDTLHGHAVHDRAVSGAVLGSNSDSALSSSSSRSSTSTSTSTSTLPPLDIDIDLRSDPIYENS